MYISHEGQNLYLKPWDFNCARLFTRIEEIVRERGGKLEKTRFFYAHNRMRSEIIDDCESKIMRYTELNAEKYSEVRADAIMKYRTELNRAKSVSSKPFRATRLHSIRFILGDFFYAYSVSDNFLFPYHWCKTPVRGGKYSKDACHDQAPDDWFMDEFLQIDCSQKIIDHAANAILDALIASKCASIIRDRERKAVPNTYNDGYHYEKE